MRAVSRGAITLLQLLEALECDFKLVGLVEAGGVVLDLDAEKRDDRHVEAGRGGGSVERREGCKGECGRIGRRQGA